MAILIEKKKLEYNLIFRFTSNSNEMSNIYIIVRKYKNYLSKNKILKYWKEQAILNLYMFQNIMFSNIL